MINPEIILQDDMMGDGMQCINHPYKKNPSGICPICLQEKLGKLVSSSFPNPYPYPYPSSFDYVCHPTSEKYKNDPFLHKKKVMGSGFWSFLHISSKSSNFSNEKSKKGEIFNDKVSRSKSIGCGNTNFSNDFFEKISNGFGDCTLRRVESQREAKPKISFAGRRISGAGVGAGEDYCMKERIKCGGIFSGFVLNSSSSSSISSSSISEDINGRSLAAGGGGDNGRSRSWGWGLASPMRGLSKASKERKRVTNPNPNLDGIPSILVVR